MLAGTMAGSFQTLIEVKSYIQTIPFILQVVTFRQFVFVEITYSKNETTILPELFGVRWSGDHILTLFCLGLPIGREVVFLFTHLK